MKVSKLFNTTIKSEYFNVRKFHVKKYSMEFNFANKQDKFVSLRLILVQWDFPSQKARKNKSAFIFKCEQIMKKLLFLAIILLWPFRFANQRVIDENFLTLKLAGGPSEDFNAKLINRIPVNEY